MTNKMIRLVSSVLCVLLLPSPALLASEAPTVTEFTVTSTPGRYAAVNGDSSKFRQLHWMNSGYVGGLDEFELKADMGEDVELEMEGRAIVDENDYEGLFDLTQEDFGYIKMEYEAFRKYYDSTGGFYRPFRTLNAVDTDKSLQMDMGKFEFEAGLTPKDLPDLTFLYEREVKEGTKSRLTWTSVYDKVDAADINKKIGPAWQKVDEVVDSITLRAEDTMKGGFHWKGEQSWEWASSNNLREEKQVSNITLNGASDVNQKLRDQYTEPEETLITTLLTGDKWFKKDTVFVSSGYRYSQLTNKEVENIYEYDQNGVLTSFSNAEQVRNAYATNLLSSHTWVGNVMWEIFKPLTLHTRLKAEQVKRRSESTYPKDNAPANNDGTQKPNGTIDQIDVSDNDEKLDTIGESVSIRYTGIPRLALYNDWEFEQTRDTLSEDRRSASANENFNRTDINHLFRGVGTLGANYIPWDHFTLSGQLRHREDDIRYNHDTYTINSTAAAKSVFVDAEFLTTDELVSKVKWAPTRWFQPAFRYQLQNRKYETWGLPTDDYPAVGQTLANIYTLDLVTQPIDQLLAMFTVTYQDAATLTQASESPTPSSSPTFDSDYVSYLASMEYSVNKDLALTGVFHYSTASNFDDFSSVGVPMGSEFDQTDVTVGARITANKNWSLEPKYAFYQYHSDPDSGTDSFNAHVTWLEVKYNWG